MQYYRFLYLSLTLFSLVFSSTVTAQTRSQYRVVKPATVFREPGFNFKDCPAHDDLCVGWLPPDAIIVDCDKDSDCAKQETLDEDRHKNFPDFKHIHFHYEVKVQGKPYVRDGDGWVDKTVLSVNPPCAKCTKKNPIVELTDSATDIFAQGVDRPEKVSIKSSLCGTSEKVRLIDGLVTIAMKGVKAPKPTCEISLPLGCGGGFHIEREVSIANSFLKLGREKGNPGAGAQACRTAMRLFTSNCGLLADKRNKYSRFEDMVKRTDKVVSRLPADQKNKWMSAPLLQCIFMVEDPELDPDVINYSACDTSARHKTSRKYFMADWNASNFGYGQVARQTMGGVIALKDPRLVKEALASKNPDKIRDVFNSKSLTERERLELKKVGQTVSDAEFDLLFKFMGEDQDLQIDIAARVLNDKLSGAGRNPRLGIRRYDSDTMGPGHKRDDKNVIRYLGKVRACFNVCLNDKRKDIPSKFECLNGIGKFIPKFSSPSEGPL